MLRSLRAEESRARFGYIRSRAEAVNEAELAKREELAKKLQVRAGLGMLGKHDRQQTVHAMACGCRAELSS